LKKTLPVWKKVLLVFLAVMLAIVATLAVLYRDMLFRDTQNFDLAGSENSQSILFVGNSEIFWGKLPRQLYIVTRMYGVEITYKDISSNGAHLINSKDEAISEMRSGNYNYIILQDNTRLLPGNNEDSLKAIRILCDEARVNGVIPVLFVPLSAKNNGQPDAGRQKIFTEAYSQAAEENNIILVDVGEAWLYAYKTIPGISLYTWDGIHPNNAGAFLTACVFAAVLFDLHIEDIPEDNLYKGSDALDLAQAAWDFVQQKVYLS
jgi:hypothetical protein